MGDNIEHIGKKLKAAVPIKIIFTTLLLSKPVMLHFQMEQTCKMPKKIAAHHLVFQFPVSCLASCLTCLVGWYLCSLLTHCFRTKTTLCVQWPCWAFFNSKILRGCSFCWLQFHILKQYMDFYERINGHSFFIEKVFSCFVGSSVF